MKIKEYILRTFAVLFIIGGAVRVVATQSTFYKLRIGYFWVDNEFYIQGNRIMGSFLIMIGILFLGFVKDFIRFKYVLGHFALGLLVIGLTIGASGYLLNLPLYSYIADAAVFSIISIFCLYIRS